MNNNSIDKEITKFVNTINRLDKKQSSKKTKIQYAEMVFDNEEIQTAIKSLLSSFSNNWFALGKNALLFQNKLASYLQVDQSVFVNSGSSANLISIATLDAKKIIKRGDEVITLSTTFPTTINPLLLYGLKPVLIDTELASFTANLEHLEKAITDKTKLIMIPHINGSPNDMKRIMEIAQKNDLAVVEDACDALGSKFDGKLAGTFGDMGTFSFYAAHHMSTGEGGAVVGNSEFLSTAESLRDWGRVNIDSNSFGNRTFSSQKISKKLPEDYEERYSYSNIGYNLKPLDMQAAIGLIQLKKLKKFTQKRKQNFKFLFENLQNFSDDLILPQSLPDADPSWFVFPITVKQTSKHKRSNLIKFLEKQGIETRPILAGNISSHPAYDKIKFRKFRKLNNSELILNNSFFVGVYPGLDQTSLEYIVNCFKIFFKN